MSTVIWPFSPNWRQGVVDQREFRTDIAVTRSGKEQRRSLRSTPRRSLEFSCLIHGSRLREFVRFMDRQQNKDILMPDWVSYATLASDHPAGAGTAVLVSTAPAWMLPGTEVLLFSEMRQERRIVQTVSGTSVTFTFAGEAWSAGTKIYRALPGLLPLEVTAGMPTNQVLSVPVTFTVNVGALPQEPFPVAPISTSGFEVFTRTPNWGESVQSLFTFPISIVDYGRGRTQNYRPVDFGTTTRRGTFYGLSRSDADALVSTFYRAKGRRGEFFMPTGLPDMDLKITIAANNPLMRVEGREIFDAYAGEQVHRGVAVTLLNGQTYYRTVNGFTLITNGGATDTLLQLADGFPINISPADVLRISWMPRHRFGSDTIRISWLTDEIAEVPMAFVSLEALPGT